MQYLKQIFSVVIGDNTQEKDLLSLFSENRTTIVYFYPRDNTPGCTIEARDFTCLQGEFEKIGVGLIGVSQDDIESHKKFMSEHSISFPLISDTELTFHKEIGSYGEKNNYGKIAQGVIRSTFLFDQKGKILKEWRNVKATGHAEKILKELQK